MGAEEPVLIIITGAPCTGKTRLARALAEHFAVPLIGKETIKESLFDTLGWSDRAWSRRLGVASTDLLYIFVEAVLRAGRPALIESNFLPEFATPRFKTLRERVAFTPLEIVCECGRETLLQRFAERWVSGARHPGHVEAEQRDELATNLDAARFGPLQLGGTVVRADTTDATAAVNAAVFAAVAAALKV